MFGKKYFEKCMLFSNAVYFVHPLCRTEYDKLVCSLCPLANTVHAVPLHDVKGQLVIPWRVSVLVNTILFVSV